MTRIEFMNFTSRVIHIYMYMPRFKKTLLAIVFIILGLAFVIQFLPAKAQTPTAGLQVRPAIFEEKADPGQSFSFILRATNIGNEPRQFYAVRQDIKGLLASGEPIFADFGEQTAYGMAEWIEIPTEPIIIGPGETKEIIILVKTPQNASPGSHLAGVFLSTEPETRLKEIGSLVGYRVGSLFNIRISGEALEEAQIREFSVEKAIYYSGRPAVKFTTRVENLGNVLIRPRGPIDIINVFGKKVATLRMNDAAAAVFLKDIRQFETVWQKDGLAFGRYQAVMSLIYGDEQKKTISATVSFWVLPLNVILPICAGLLILILGTHFGLRLYVKRKIREVYEATKAVSGQSPPDEKKKEEEIILVERKAPLPKIAFAAVGLLLAIIIFLILIFFLFA